MDKEVYERFIEDPTLLPAYQKYVRPRIQHVLGPNGEDNARLHSVEALMKSKTWYIAPVELKAIEREALGIVWDESGGKQLGLQFGNEIWIDKKPFPTMTLEQQGDLLLHEFVMLVYFLKFERISDVCARFYKGAGIAIPENACAPEADNYFPTEKLRPLNKTDYQNIRRVTGLLKLEGEHASPERIKAFFTSNGFADIPLFSQAFHPVKRDPLVLPAAEIINQIRKASLSRAFLSPCSLANLSKSFDCQLDLKEPVMFPASNVEAKLETLLFRAGEVNGQTQLLIVDKGMDITLPALFDHIHRKVFFLTYLVQNQIPKKIGHRFYNLGVLIERSRPPEDRISLGALVFAPYVVTSAEGNHCLATRMGGKTPSDDAIIFATSIEFKSIARLYGNSQSEFPCSP
ncbi:MAG: hypothetical protein AB7G93_09275 [Bdellovibrionales bacterium]